MSRLAFYGIFFLKGRRGKKEVQGFFDNMPLVWRALGKTEGLVKMAGAKVDARDHPPISMKKDAGLCSAKVLSIWTDLESVHAFVYNGKHGEVFRTGKIWCVRTGVPLYAAWWIGDDHIPDWKEAYSRLNHIDEHGSDPFAFDFLSPFDDQGRPFDMKQRVLKEKADAVNRIVVAQTRKD